MEQDSVSDRHLLQLQGRSAEVLCEHDLEQGNARAAAERGEEDGESRDVRQPGNGVCRTAALHSPARRKDCRGAAAQ
eukprot:1563028-Rhodomonas_salina.1